MTLSPVRPSEHIRIPNRILDFGRGGSGGVRGEGSDFPGTWTSPSNDGKIRGREGEDSGSGSSHRGIMVEADGAWGSRQK